MAEEIKLDFLERVSLMGAGFGIFVSGMYLGFTNSSSLVVSPLETTLLAVGPSTLNVMLYTHLTQRRLSRENTDSNLEENVNSPRLLPKCIIGGSAASLTLFGLSYGFGYCMGKLTEF